MERAAWKPNVEISPNCPRCGSSNTKFCYYNNYSLTQPRYFCKGCRRYWTKGGSLRNVPVGGGCRKNRRGRALRLSTEHHAVRSLGYGCLSTNNDSFGHSYGNKINCFVEPTSSSTTIHDGSHIDLALVYANFLNPPHHDSKTPQQDSKSINSGLEMLELPSDQQFDPSLEFSSMTSTDLDSNPAHLPQDNNSIVGCRNVSNDIAMPLTDTNHMYYCGFELVQNIKHHDKVLQHCTIQDASNYGLLPPLPGEDIACPEILWSNSCLTLQETQQQAIGPEAQDPNPLVGNWSPFDLSSDHDTLSRT